MKTIILMILASGFAQAAGAFTANEHLSLSRAVFDSVMMETGVVTGGSVMLPVCERDSLRFRYLLSGNRDFSHLCMDFASNDGAEGRYQKRLKTILEQLDQVSHEDLDKLWQEKSAKFSSSYGSDTNGEPRLPLPDAGGAVANFWVHHWLALRFASLAAEQPKVRTEAFQQALIFEAAAQGFLADTFSASHLLPPPGPWTRWLAPVNYQTLHDSYREPGLYVINSRHQVWMCFGDGVLTWHTLAYNKVKEACESSLREVLITFYQQLCPEAVPTGLKRWIESEYPAGGASANILAWRESEDGARYYVIHHVPSLMDIPMPIAASWSVRGTTVVPGARGVPMVHERLYFPQLREKGLYNPQLDPELVAKLYSREALPKSFVLPALEQQSAVEIILEDSTLASVEYWQAYSRPPSFRGALVGVGAGDRVDGPGAGGLVSFTLGWGFIDDLVPVRWLPDLQRVAVELWHEQGLGSGEGSILGSSLTFQLRIPSVLDLYSELGYAWGTETPQTRHGPAVALGVAVDGPSVPFAYLGTLLRLKWRTVFLEQITGGLSLELVIH